MKFVANNIEKESIPVNTTESGMIQRLMRYLENEIEFGYWKISLEEGYDRGIDMVITTQNNIRIGIEFFKTNNPSVGLKIISRIERIAIIKNELNLDHVIIFANKPFDTSPKIIAENLGVFLSSMDDMNSLSNFLIREKV